MYMYMYIMYFNTGDIVPSDSTISSNNDDGDILPILLSWYVVERRSGVVVISLPW